MPRKKAKPARRSRFRLLILGNLLIALCVLGALATGYLLYLDRMITSTFDGRRWSVPARVYAQPLELYPGLELEAEDIEVELKRLGYRRGPLTAPGMYSRAGNEVRAVLRTFTFNDGTRAETPIRVRIADHAIDTLYEGDEPSSLVRLEPPMIGSFFATHGEDRLIVTPEETPKLLSEGLKAVEDRNFDTHVGFDPKAILRALLVDLRSGDLAQGGSTLTQQLVKSYFLDNRRTLLRKIKELAMAVILDARYEKADLLNAYINEIYLGQDGERAVHGFGLGSQFYFNKPLSELDAAEIALLIAVIRGPSYYNPFTHPQRARARRDLVLGQMNEFGLITAQEHAKAVRQPLALTRTAREGGGYYPAFLDLVREQLGHDYDANELASRGYRVFTTLEPRVQDAAGRAVASTLDRIETDRKLPRGDLESAVLVANNQTGEISAVVGGRKAGFQGFNRALNARRPVGSLLKPVVYLTALETGQYNLASIIEDAPLPPLPNGRNAKDAWTPHNFDNEIHGPVPIVRALGDSLNLATVRLGQTVGVEKVAARVAAFTGIEQPPAFPSLLLGAIDLTPLDMLKLYGVFASGGFATPVKTVLAVEDEAGTTLNRYPLEMHQVAAPEAVAQLNYALTLVLQRGTAHASRLANRGLAGKTGTSDDFRDSWFAGFDATHLAVVWVGYDDNRDSKLTGSAGALQVWDALMIVLHPTPIPLPVPTGFELQTIDYATGTLTRSDCGEPGAEPVTVPIPYNAPLPAGPGCGTSLMERFRQWFSD
jgi:penicillin-binding protein 1B